MTLTQLAFATLISLFLWGAGAVLLRVLIKNFI